ncbi:peptide deformylase [Thermosipho melanesiensis]|uniref:Peptide deformylase n=2 Tax=Thermosipho melanesiensis TaxID=46541 RepID=A6LL97_THEM4|nr:peptide deformylase [Thermosipho melanesiensis]ABR30698.1 peptide deformylase [Thermosipho melanesiensis BI429]APT73828.1 peptide deformylase [Thermosipho melanesiensis]OOC35767.1 peptide deformylase [Thermosipho melanesiensis]OOC39066.1 peptide deformylase [Thermosipho melanesiensis]OOC39214.1 peptide deformylase [Thermosipho melanesiensis]
MRIRLYGDPILRKSAKAVKDFKYLQEIKEDMLKTMYLEDGVGLAAPQVGLSLRFFVMDDGSGPLFIVNPEIIAHSEEKEIGEEGCLSLPGIFENVERYKWVKLKFQDEYGKVQTRLFEGYSARIVQHERDHLDGILFIDHLPNAVKRRLAPELSKIMRMRMEEKK